jgi:HEAT repeat protein
MLGVRHHAFSFSGKFGGARLMLSSLTRAPNARNAISLAGGCAALLILLLPATTTGEAGRKAGVQNQPKSAGSIDDSAQLCKQSWMLLDDASRSENVRIRTDVIGALSSMEGDERAIHLIENALDDRHSQVRRLAAASLGTMHATEAIPYLKKTMNDKNAGVSFAAAEALWKMGAQDGAPNFYAVLLGSHQVEPGFVSSQVTDAWSELHNPTALANIGIGEASGALLGPFSEGVTVARELARDRGAKARALSATILGEHPNPGAEKILEDTLDDKNVAVKVAVAKALGGFDDPAIITRLAPLLSEKGMPLFKRMDTVHFMVAASIVRLHNHAKPDSPITTAAALVPPALNRADSGERTR